MKRTNSLLLGGLAITLVALSSCQRTQTASAEKLATRFGDHPEATDPEAEANAIKEEAADIKKDAPNRFGFGGGESEKLVKPLDRDVPPVKKKVTEVKKQIPAPPKIKKPEAPVAPKLPTPKVDPNLVKLGYANQVSGDPLHVTLPGEFASLGPISIERISATGTPLGSPWAKGTQMQIPNPKLPGGKIYFKVP